MNPERTISRRMISWFQFQLIKMEMWLLSTDRTPSYPPPRQKLKRRNHLKLVTKTEEEKEAEPFWPKKSRAALRLVK